MTYFCPACWREIVKAEVCPYCQADLREFSDETFEQKLIRALHHPEPSTPIRAATILGKRRTKAAVEPLIDLGLSTSDPYVQEAAVVALGLIGDPRARACLELLSREGALRTRGAAVSTLEMLAAKIEHPGGQGQ
jgi:HEAT repeat protein